MVFSDRPDSKTLASRNRSMACASEAKFCTLSRQASPCFCRREHTRCLRGLQLKLPGAFSGSAAVASCLARALRCDCMPEHAAGFPNQSGIGARSALHAQSHGNAPRGWDLKEVTIECRFRCTCALTRLIPRFPWRRDRKGAHVPLQKLSGSDLGSSRRLSREDL